MRKIERWETEQLFFDNDDFYRSLIAEIDLANKAVDMEVYTFEDGILADRLLDCFQRAKDRGVRVRLICDHWGSPLIGQSLNQKLVARGVKTHIFRRLPWRTIALGNKNPLSFMQIWKRIRSMNRGFHRKVTIVDNQTAWISSLNVTDVHLKEVYGKNAWVDIGVRVTGNGVMALHHAFERAYFRRRKPRNRVLEKQAPVHLNDSFWSRRMMTFMLKRRLKRAKTRIWIQNPYFLPERGLLRALYRQARKGIDVRLILPEKNDQPIISWMNYGILRKLAKNGAKIFEYQPSFAHKKVLIVDNESSIGSTNFNHRSFLHDLEVEVMITHDLNKIALEKSFFDDQALSREITLSELKGKSIWFRLLNRTLFFFRYWC